VARKTVPGIRESWEDRTGRVGQFILATLDLVLQTLSFAPGRSNLGLHLFAGHVGHFAGQEPLKVAVLRWRRKGVNLRVVDKVGKGTRVGGERLRRGG
jgi:hypothetical protein